MARAALYPFQSAEFLAMERDPFRNPVGSTVRRALGILLDELLRDMDRTRTTGALDSVMQIRAIQDLLPSRAVEFLFQLRGILRPQITGPEREILDGRIDELALTGVRPLCEISREDLSGEGERGPHHDRLPARR